MTKRALESTSAPSQSDCSPKTCQHQTVFVDEYEDVLPIMQSIGDMQLHNLCKHGDVMIKMFYGHITEVAGHVDGLCNLFKSKYEAGLKIRPMVTKTINHIQHCITQPILHGVVPRVSDTVVASVLEVKTMLQMWVLTCMLLEPDFCSYLANQSSDTNAFRHWFEHSRTVLSTYFTGTMPQSVPTNSLPAIYTMNKIVVKLAAMYIVLVPTNHKADAPSTL